MTTCTHLARAERADLLALLTGLTPQQWDTPSLCAGWTRGHVLTHVARNADGIADTLAGALRGEVVERYPGGPSARDAAIEAGAGRPADVLRADVRDSAERLDAVFGAVGAADAWHRETEKDHPARHWLGARWKEVEIHRVDLAGGYSPRQWPPAMVARLLEAEAARLPTRARTALRVSVTAEGSLRPELGGREWSIGEGAAVEVRGPDWAVLAWLLGRPAVVADELTATPELYPFG